MTSIITYNVNGIRSAISKGLLDWLALEQPDVLCLQEVKALEHEVNLADFAALGYRHCWHTAEKKGYSGVATFSKRPPDLVQAGCDLPDYDREGRILRTDFGDWTLLNCYFPSGTMGETRQGFKMTFLQDFFHYVQQLRQSRPRLVVVGDYNIAHTELDIHNPKSNKNTTGFLPEERAWMQRWFDSGFVDAYRQLSPTERSYSWWSYRAGARQNNKGWRIDYQSVSADLADRIRATAQLTDVLHSDHCPVRLLLDI